MNTQNISTSQNLLVENKLGCHVYDTGWQNNSKDLNVQVEGEDLKAKLKFWERGAQNTISDNTGEALGAVLSGKFELRLGAEQHILTTGDAVLIPDEPEYTWTALESGFLYQVKTRTKP